MREREYEQHVAISSHSHGCLNYVLMETGRGSGWERGREGGERESDEGREGDRDCACACVCVCVHVCVCVCMCVCVCRHTNVAIHLHVTKLVGSNKVKKQTIKKNNH